MSRPRKMKILGWLLQLDDFDIGILLGYNSNGVCFGGIAISFLRALVEALNWVLA